MKLYVCWGTWTTPKHHCGDAAEALRDAGHEPEVVRSYGWKALPDTPFNMTSGRKRAKQLSGSTTVPVLELDDGTVVADTQEIVAWAKAHPAGAGAAA